jgi:hypothetical protein
MLCAWHGHFRRQRWARWMSILKRSSRCSKTRNEHTITRSTDTSSSSKMLVGTLLQQCWRQRSDGGFVLENPNCQYIMMGSNSKADLRVALAGRPGFDVCSDINTKEFPDSGLNGLSGLSGFSHRHIPCAVRMSNHLGCLPHRQIFGFRTYNAPGEWPLSCPLHSTEAYRFQKWDSVHLLAGVLLIPTFLGEKCDSYQVRGRRIGTWPQAPDTSSIPPSSPEAEQHQE